MLLNFICPPTVPANSKLRNRFCSNAPLSGDDEKDAAAAVAAAAKAAADATDDGAPVIGAQVNAATVECFDDIGVPSIADHGRLTGTGGVGDTYFLLARGATSLT